MPRRELVQQSLRSMLPSPNSTTPQEASDITPAIHPSASPRSGPDPVAGAVIPFSLTRLAVLIGAGAVGDCVGSGDAVAVSGGAAAAGRTPGLGAHSAATMKNRVRSGPYGGAPGISASVALVPKSPKLM